MLGRRLVGAVDGFGKAGPLEEGHLAMLVVYKAGFVGWKFVFREGGQTEF